MPKFQVEYTLANTYLVEVEGSSVSDVQERIRAGKVDFSALLPFHNPSDSSEKVGFVIGMDSPEKTISKKAERLARRMALRLVKEMGLTFDVDAEEGLYAPQGKVWTATHTHWLAFTGWPGFLGDVQAGIEDCAAKGCDACNPES